MSQMTCFVAMPFRPELNYFYLYIRHYLNKQHGLHVERGDHTVAAGSLLDKVKRQIRAADLLIVDISGGNANVFYELGLADSYDKKVVLISSEPADDAPIDIRHRELIQYDLGRHDEFLIQLDKAINSILLERYVTLYERALGVLREFNSASGRAYPSASREQFRRNVMKWESSGGLPDGSDPMAQAEFLLPKILDDPTDTVVLREVWNWLKGLDAAASP